MKLPIKKTLRAFTLVELMIVVAIISLLAAMGVPSYIRARKRSQASRILNDLRAINSAIDQYAIEQRKVAGQPVAWSDIQAYLKFGSTLYSSGGQDLLAHDFGSFSVDAIPVVPGETFQMLSDVAPSAFWSPYR